MGRDYMDIIACAFGGNFGKVSVTNDNGDLKSRLHKFVTKLAYAEVKNAMGEGNMKEVFEIVEELEELRKEYQDKVDRLQEQAEELGFELD